MNKRHRAFTLLELLIATAIFSMLVAVMYSVLYSAIRLRRSAEEAGRDAIPRDRLINMLKRDLECVVVPAGVLAGPIIVESEEDGDRPLDRIEFFATTGIVTNEAPWAEVQKVEYFLDEPLDDEDLSGTTLVRKLTRNLLPGEVDEEDTTGEQRVAQGVESLLIEIFDGESWIETWDSTTLDNENPQGIRMRVAFSPAGEAGARLPVEVVSPIMQHPRPVPAGAAPAGGGGASQ